MGLPLPMAGTRAPAVPAAGQKPAGHTGQTGNGRTGQVGVTSDIVKNFGKGRHCAVSM